MEGESPTLIVVNTLFNHKHWYLLHTLEYSKKILQHQMSVLPQPLALNPLKDMPKVNGVDYTANFDNLYSKINDLKSFSKVEKYLIAWQDIYQV